MFHICAEIGAKAGADEDVVECMEWGRSVGLCFN